MEDIAYSPATPADLPAVRGLLERCGLPTEDLRPDHLERFFVCHARLLRECRSTAASCGACR
jgi:hypothetical protein